MAKYKFEVTIREEVEHEAYSPTHKILAEFSIETEKQTVVAACFEAAIKEYLEFEAVIKECLEIE